MGRRAWAWILAATVVLTLANAAWTFREPLLELRWLRGSLENLGLVEARPYRPFRNLEALRLINRDLHSHSTLAGVLVLNATFISDAARPQAWPRLELTLLDSTGGFLARRYFHPGEYLGRDFPPGELLAPGLHVPARLELIDPGARATDFKLRFH
ncbi:MAG: DUF3426 domain-containing protein [Xanthomonadales bacterium]|nr:DUF3426 domain-containing protein [Xanthomonadales bacterium]NIX14088.1 DUF3426 domain-containing protein [Xanthomonadales bacterium]